MSAEREEQPESERETSVTQELDEVPEFDEAFGDNVVGKRNINNNKIDVPIKDDIVKLLKEDVEDEKALPCVVPNLM